MRTLKEIADAFDANTPWHELRADFCTITEAMTKLLGDQSWLSDPDVTRIREKFGADIRWAKEVGSVLTSDGLRK